jgi:N-methylhydantoinase B
MDATGAGISAAMQCLLLALGASPEAPEHRLLSAQPSLGWAMMTWAFARPDGRHDNFIHTDGTLGGSPPAATHDGVDLTSDLIGLKGSIEMPDVEILEASYPVLMETRASGRGVHGLGTYRSGGACREILRPHGVEAMTGFMISTRGSVPNQGAAGGGLGTRTALRLHRADGSSEDVPLQAAGVRLAAGDAFELRGPTAGGFGDPLARPLALVAQDVRQGRIGEAEAERFYAVVFADGEPDSAASEALRTARRQERLREATAPAKPVTGTAAAQGAPLHPGVVQNGARAVSTDSGAVLALAPDPWTGGCATLDEEDVGANGYVVRTRAYLDPISGRRLLLEILLPDGTSAFECSPDRWTGIAPAR